MSQYWIMAAILLPILGGAAVFLLPFPSKKSMYIYLEVLTVLTSVLVWSILLSGKTEGFTVIHFMDDLKIAFRIDGLGMIFAGLISLLWPFATLYSFEYMEHEEHKKVFFMFYSCTYGVTLGISFAQNMLTMYFFYELLTLVTVPLIIHPLTKEAIRATRKYLYYSLGGAAFALIGIVFVIIYGTTLDFQLGGVLPKAAIVTHGNTLLFIYLIAFLGFGVKAAIWPVCSWLPQAGVAPTPVTALLHAVAVVKAGVFGIIRLTYYCFGTEFLRGTWAQNVAMCFAMITIVYGCYNAVKQNHIKKRLAYSTISNLSYIIFSVTIMTPLGLIGAMAHLVCHAVMKICSFLCAGAIMHQTGKHNVTDLNGIGRKMPIVFACFTVSALGLMGVPGIAGFVSKWNIAAAAVDSGNRLAYGGTACLLVSALLTSIYMMSIVFRAYIPVYSEEEADVMDVKDPTWKMCTTLIVFAIASVLLGLFSGPLIDFMKDIAYGRF